MSTSEAVTRPDMQLRSRNLADDSDMRDEEEALIEDTEDEEVDGGGGGEDKKGIAGDERNILVLLFLYVLQVSHHKS